MDLAAVILSKYESKVIGQNRVAPGEGLRA
jgi:hypothetical protein